MKDQDSLSRPAWPAAHVPSPWVITGPAEAESREQVLAVARRVADLPHVLAFSTRLWKTGTDPNSSAGVGQTGLGWLRAVKDETALKTATEVAHPSHVELCIGGGVDILWIGARTTANPPLVQEITAALSGCDLPVMVKNPITSELGLWLGAVERLQQAGINRIVAIHRGFSVFRETEYRESPNWRIPIELKLRFPDLPLACDPCRIARDGASVERIAQMALNLGVSGLMIATHCNPDQPLTATPQQITPETLATLLQHLRPRRAGTGDPPPEIGRIRSLIDDVDRRLILDLSERFALVDEIGDIKRRHDIPVLQLERWEDLLEDHLARAEGKGLDSRLIKALFELIHARAVELQL